MDGAPPRFVYMKALKGFLAALILLTVVPYSAFAQGAKIPQLRLNSAKNLEIISTSGKIFTFKSITLQEDVTIDGVKYKVSFGPGAAEGDMVAILQPADAAEVTVNDPKFPKSSVQISSQAVAIFTFNADNGTLVVEAGAVGVVKVNNIALAAGERVAVNPDGTLVRNLGSAPAPANTAVAQNSQNSQNANNPGQTSNDPEQPAPTLSDFIYGPGQGNNPLAQMSINLNPEAATPVLSGQ